MPNERLLEFDVRDGWEPLCDFLHKPIPKEPFPRTNQRYEFLALEPEWSKTIRERLEIIPGQIISKSLQVEDRSNCSKMAENDT